MQFRPNRIQHRAFLPRATVILLVVVTGINLAGADPAPKTPKDYREAALRREGVPNKGGALFSDARTRCSQCHSITGKGATVGPDLFAVGDKYSRADLVRSVLEPSASIMNGFSTTVIETQDGMTLQGILKAITDQELLLVNGPESVVRVRKSNILSQTSSPVSLMPEGLHAALSVEEFADLVAYLESLKQSEFISANAAGTPAQIEALKRQVRVVPMHSASLKFDWPIWTTEHPGRGARNTFFVAEQRSSKIWLLHLGGGSDRKAEFVDLHQEVFTTETEGLLGVVLHPRFAENRRYFVMHEVMRGTQRGLRIGERRARPDLLADSGEATRTVLYFDVTTEVHHGGMLEFGPDGYLYIGMGDGGPQEDPLGHAQDLTRLFAKILRIDVDHRLGDAGYSIPWDNPFISHPNPAVRREIWAYGLRQPWRFSFDPVTRDLWVGDVGQDRFEEVDIVRPGENYGWNVFEGFELFSTAHRRTESTYVAPIISFRRRHGTSVTGGYVYRAQPDSTFYGVYLCGDFESKRIWGITQKNRVLQQVREIGVSPAKIVSFGRDLQGEICLVGYDTGMIYRIDLTAGKFE